MITGFVSETAPKCSSLKLDVVLGMVPRVAKPLITAMPTNKIVKVIVRENGLMVVPAAILVETVVLTTMMDNVVTIVQIAVGVGPVALRPVTHRRIVNVKEEVPQEEAMPVLLAIGTATSLFANKAHFLILMTTNPSACPMAESLLTQRRVMPSCKEQLPVKSATSFTTEVKRLL